jgi:hypothetical protein
LPHQAILLVGFGGERSCGVLPHQAILLVGFGGEAAKNKQKNKV